MANHKLVHRLYQEEKLAIRRRGRQKRGLGGVLAGSWCPIAADQRWSLDFTEDGLANGRKFRTANLKDDCTREGPAIVADFSLPENFQLWQNLVTAACDVPARRASSAAEHSSTLSGRSRTKSATLRRDGGRSGRRARIRCAGSWASTLATTSWGGWGWMTHPVGAG